MAIIILGISFSLSVNAESVLQAVILIQEKLELRKHFRMSSVVILIFLVIDKNGNTEKCNFSFN